MDVSDLTIIGGGTSSSIRPIDADLQFGTNVSFNQVDAFSNAFTSPISFGTGFTTPASSATGDFFRISPSPVPFGGVLVVPVNYISGTNINGTITFDNSTFASLGVTPGTYTYNLTNSSGDSIVLDIGVTPVPFEFSPVVGVSLLGGLWLGRKALKRKKSK